MKAARQLMWHSFDSLPSTQVKCRELLLSCPAVEDLIVVADDQTAGLTADKGSRWMHFKKNLAVSIGVSLHVSNKDLWQMTPLVQLIGPLSLLAYLKEETQVDSSKLHLKWPNDIYFDGRKVAGTLTELISKHSDSMHDRVIFGMGVNIAGKNDPVEKYEAEHNISFLPDTIKRDALAKSVYHRTVAWLQLYEQKSADYLFDTLSSEVDRNLLWVGQRVQVFPKGEIDHDSPSAEGTLLGINRSAGIDLKSGGRLVQVNQPMSLRLARR